MTLDAIETGIYIAGLVILFRAIIDVIWLCSRSLKRSKNDIVDNRNRHSDRLRQ